MSESRIRKFQKLFNPQVPENEKLINYFSCALIADILLQGHLYISENYFSFYSNVFGYVTKLVIPISSVSLISKEKTAKMFPNAIGIQAFDVKHVFGSFLSRETAFQLMQGMVKMSQTPVIEMNEEKEEDGVDFVQSSKEDTSSLSSESPTAQFQIPEDLIAEPIKELKILPTPQFIQAESVVADESQTNSTSTILLIGIALTIFLAFFSAFLLIRINSIETRKYIYSTQRDFSEMTLDEAEKVLDKNIMTVRNVREKLQELQMILESSFNEKGSREEL